MVEILRSATFQRWLDRLRDRRAVARINSRLQRLEHGYYGDTRSVGDGVSEMRVGYGPGYRLYFMREGGYVVVLLCGGDKDTQSRDIRLANRIARARR